MSDACAADRACKLIGGARLRQDAVSAEAARRTV
jgi:hypothetical protein